MSENEIRNACADWLLFHHWLVLRINSGAATSEGAGGKLRFVSFNRWQTLGIDPQTAGVSDLICFKAGCPPLAVEAKMKGNTPTPAQLRFMAAWEAAGGVSIVAHSVDDLEAVLGA